MSTHDPEAYSSGPPNATTPLLPSSQRQISQLRSSSDWIECHIIRIHGEVTVVFRLRHVLQNFLSSKWGHYFVLGLVSLDISFIFADFLISLHICEHSGEKGFHAKTWIEITNVLSAMSFVFTCLFVAELLASIFAFGFSYFNSKFHCFDAAIIIAGFIVDILLRGPLEEAGSLVVVLRLWRAFKIIEEFSTASNDEMDGLYRHIDQLKEDNDKVRSESDKVRSEIETLRKRAHANGSGNMAI